MAKYAKDTQVSVEKSRDEIESTLKRYGATAFMYGWNEGGAVVGFEIDRRRFRILVPLPEAQKLDSIGRRLSNTQIVARREQDTRQRWRAMALYIKAILEARESKIVTMEQALQWYEIMPNGQTFGEWLGPQLEQMYLTGRMPPMLPGLPSGET